jgi:hypothetical protein
VARGYRPFSAENCPLDSFPGAPNPYNANVARLLEALLIVFF